MSFVSPTPPPSVRPRRAPNLDRGWARWRNPPTAYTIGVEEEVMLLDHRTHALAPRADAVLAELPDVLRGQISPETHASVVELKTHVHDDVAAAMDELRILRECLAAELALRGLRGASAGTHALAAPAQSENSGDDRYREVARTMRSLANREPTMALHLHIGIPHSEDAIRVLNRIRENLPLLIALSANSPFAQGRDSGFCSARTVIFGGFPRTGAPRAFRSYLKYVQAVDTLIAPGAIPDPTFLWWDARLQPALGTVEVRAMDAQTTLSEVAPLAALVQSLARLELEGEPSDRRSPPEVVEENRFLAARDGRDAHLIAAGGRRLSPLRELAEALVDECRPHAAALGCSEALAGVIDALDANGADHQRAWASGAGVEAVLPALADRFLER